MPETPREHREQYGPREWAIRLPAGASAYLDALRAQMVETITAQGWEPVNPDDDPDIHEIGTHQHDQPVATYARLMVRRPRGHLLHVAKTADWHPDEHDWDIKVTCLNPDRCDGWQECPGNHEQDGISAADGPWEGDEDAPWFEEEEWDFHGVAHTWRYGYGWTVPYPGCVVADNDNVREQGWEIAEEHGAGVYAVEDEWDDDYVTLNYLRPATPEEIAR